MRRRLVATFAVLAGAAVLITWVAARTSGSPALLVVLLVVVVGGGLVTGLVASSRLAASFRELVRRDHTVAVTASHELRTPITALRLSLEDLTLWRTTPREVSDELNRAIHELDRLSDAVTHLLDGHRHDQVRAAERIDLTALTSDAVASWRPQLDRGRSVRLDTSGAAHARLDAGSVAQVLAVVLDQFAAPGQGDVVVEVETLGRTVRVSVADESAQRFAPGVIHGPTSGKGTGDRLSLPEAGALAEALGGYLAVDDSPTTCLMLILPTDRSETLV